MAELDRTSRLFLVLTAIVGFVGVVAGAVGAHPPENFLQEASSREAWNSGVYFLLFHVVVILACADLKAVALRPFRLVAGLFLCGILLFSGSIFALAAGGPSWLGPITPLGGLCLLVGWLVLAFRLIRARG